VRRLPILLLAALALLSIAPTAARAASKVTLSLELEPATAERGAPTDMIIWAEVERGWHIHAHKPNETYLVATAATVTIPEGVVADEITYPRPDRQTFTFAGNKELLVYEGKIGITTALHVPATFLGSRAEIGVRLRYQACNDTTCLPPASETLTVVVPIAAAVAGAASVDLPSADPSGEIGRWIHERSLPVTLLLVMLLGLGLNLTPCVYPLISVTVAFFGTQGHRSLPRVAALASLYVLGITVSFATIGVAAASSGGVFGALLQKPSVLLFIAALMVVLALSSFGVYQLRPPIWLMRRASGSAQGAVGALFMGLTMGVVAAPCVGPVILGLLLFVGSRQDVALGFALFFALGLGMGLPYLVLALVAGSIRSLPRSGEWLVWVEHLFGFILLGMAVYFVSPLLPAPIQRVALPALAAVAAVFLGFIDRAGSQRPAFRAGKRVAGLGVAMLAMWAMLPPAAESAIAWRSLEPASLAAARDAGRPAIVDFVADWCIPCHEMERTTYRDPAVLAEAERFVMLKVDITRESEETTQLADDFQVKGVPTLIFYDSDGREVQRLVGYTGPEELLAAMRPLR